MRELHLKLRTLSLDNATCPDSERYPFLKEIINLDKKRVANWDIYDHFIPGTPVPDSVNPDSDVVNPTEDPEKDSVNPAEAPAEAKPKKATAKRTTKKTAKK